MPSRLSTARPPSRPISMAKAGLTTPSMAAAMTGMAKRRPHSSQDRSTSLGLTVRAPGTSAMSSKPYAARAFRPRPTHMPMLTLPRYLEIARRAHTVCGVKYTRGSVGVSTGAAARFLAPLAALRGGAGVNVRPSGPGFSFFKGGPRRAPFTPNGGQPGGQSGSGAGRFFPDQAQALEAEVRVDGLDRAGDALHLGGEAARADDLRVAAELGAHALDEAVHEARVAEHDARLDVGDRVAPDGGRRRDELHAE